MCVSYRSAAALAAALALGPVSSAWADDLVPPNWRGQPNTSWVQWEFLTNSPTPAPDAGFLPFGPASILVTPGTGAGWHATQPTAQFGGPLYNPQGDSGDGWWNLSGQIDVTLQNSTDPNPHKEIWIQLTWEPQSPTGAPVVQLTDPAGAATTIPLVQQVIWDSGDELNPWRKVYHSVFHLDIRPNPDQESIQIRGGINVDELVIDTWCVPVPSPSSAWMGLAMFGLLAVRRRARAVD